MGGATGGAKFTSNVDGLPHIRAMPAENPEEICASAA
jgi:hypothetical protein